jgi:RNA polymerase sigma-70 factor (ECF subfamily)
VSETREETYRRLYASHFDVVLGYALRRTDRPEDAADVTAETFLVAWRRLAHVPTGAETRPWLYGVARRVLANHRRGDHRRTALSNRLGDRLRKELATSVPDTSDDVVQRADVVTAMGRLSGRDQEVLQPREIAEVLGLTTTVVRPRLSRARARLRELLPDFVGNDPEPPGHLPSRQQPTLAQLTRKEQQ